MPKGYQMVRIAVKSKLDERNDEINGCLENGLNLTATLKLIDCNRQTLAN
jgi:hypothetical protein